MAYNQTGYAAGISPSGGSGASVSVRQSTEYLDIGKLKRQYLDYLEQKLDEIDESKLSRRYYHGSQWTDEQIKVLKARKQPVITANRVSRKIDAVVGLVERLRQDPKAYPRTPQHEEGAEIATATLRYVLDQQEWKAKSPLNARDGAVSGLSGLELILESGDRGDPEVGLEIVDQEDFFYDPRSVKPDFSDAGYMGTGKWVDVERAIEMFPDHEDELRAAVDSGEDLSSNPDREQKWFNSQSKQIRLVDHWYRHKGGWCWCIYTGAGKLMEGKSYLIDEKGKPFCKYIMYSGNVDHDGDRYGFVRNLRSMQDEINMRRSKSLHHLNTRRIFVSEDGVSDVEITRREVARPDGVVKVRPGVPIRDAVLVDDWSADFAGQQKLLEDAKLEIENFGPNPAVMGQGGVENSSGRAIALLQQAGIAELGPYILAYRGWKVRVYRAIWNAIQKHWTGERWIRVTDSEDVAQFIELNKVDIDPQTGMPALVNALGSLDVDIIIDEGPDTVNTMADTYETITAMAQAGAQVPPGVVIELSPLPASTKKRIMDLLEQASQPDPMQQQAVQIQLAGESAKVEETQSKTLLNMAKAQTEGMPDAAPTMQMPEEQVPIEVQTAKMMAEIDATQAKAEHSRAQAYKSQQEASLAPMQMAQDAFNSAADRDQRAEQAKQSAQMKAQQAKRTA